MTRGGLVAKNDAGTIDDITRSPAGALRVAVKEFETDVPIRPFSTFRTGQANVANSAVSVAFPALANRKTLRITNTDLTLKLYWGDINVSDTTGDVIMPLSTKELPMTSASIVYLFAQPTTGSFTTTVVTGANIISTGVLNPTNVRVDDTNFATFSGSGTNLKLSGFQLATSDPVFSPVKFSFKAKNDAVLFNTSSYVESVSASATGGTSIASANIVGISGSVYVAAIANGQTTPRDVTSVSGLGLTWSRVVAQTDSAANGYLHIYVSTGIPNVASGAVTANFTAAVQNSAIAVSRYTGVNVNNPVLTSGSTEAAGGGTAAILGGPISGSAIGQFYAAVNGINRTSVTWTTPTPSIFDFRSAANVLLAGATSQSLGGLLNFVTGTLNGGNADWCLGYLTLNPAPIGAPGLVLSYILSGAVGATTLTASLTSSTESTFTMDASSDRIWTLSTINAVTMSLSCSFFEGSYALVNQMAENITSENSSSLVRITFAELA